ncbi:MAG: hypothetical protein R3A10_14570 [Caldilineaceae bacterium]
MDAWVEEWQKMLGVVSRQEYLALLEKNAELQRRLEQAEATINALQALVTGAKPRQSGPAGDGHVGQNARRNAENPVRVDEAVAFPVDDE